MKNLLACLSCEVPSTWDKIGTQINTCSALSPIWAPQDKNIRICYHLMVHSNKKNLKGQKKISNSPNSPN